MTTASITPRFGELAGDLAAGTGDGQAALVFLPGLTSTGRCGARPCGHCARSIRRTTLALDMPGEGESIGTSVGSRSRSSSCTSRSCRRLENPVLIGHSGSAIGAMFDAMKYPVRGIVNVNAVVDNNAFSAQLRALEPQLRNGRLPAVWDELFAGLHAERSGPAGEAMCARRRGQSRRHARRLGTSARTSAHSRERHRRRIANLRAQQTPYTLVLGEARHRDAPVDGRALSRGHGDRAPEQRALPPRRPPRRVRPYPRELP